VSEGGREGWHRRKTKVAINFATSTCSDVMSERGRGSMATKHSK